jgi:predicted RNA-binding Zn ribbon-like protein
VTLVTLYFVAIQFINLSPNAFRPRSVAAISLGLILPIMIMNAIVAGVAEEAAYRGYMQGMLERRFSATVAVALVTIVFTGFAPARRYKDVSVGHSRLCNQHCTWHANQRSRNQSFRRWLCTS